MGASACGRCTEARRTRRQAPWVLVVAVCLRARRARPQPRRNRSRAQCLRSISVAPFLLLIRYLRPLRYLRTAKEGADEQTRYVHRCAHIGIVARRTAAAGDGCRVAVLRR